MRATMIPDSDLIAAAETVTIWVASPEAPTDMWSLTEAVEWVMRQPGRQRISLFRAPGDGMRAAWLRFDQIERLAFALGIDDVSTAA